MGRTVALLADALLSSPVSHLPRPPFPPPPAPPSTPLLFSARFVALRYGGFTLRIGKQIDRETLMKLTIVKRQIIFSFVTLMLIGLSSQAKAQNETKHIELLSYSFGIIQGQTARISITLRRLANPRLADEPISARFQLLDTEGEVIAESAEIRVRPGQTRFWDQPRSVLPAS